MNCVVTGAAGFIGANLCEYLINQGHRVIGIDNLSNGNRNNIKSFSRNLNFKFFEIDIRDKKAMDTAFSEFKQINVVFHQAALGSVPRSFKIPMDVFNNNVVGFDVVLNTCHKHNVQKLIFAS